MTLKATFNMLLSKCYETIKVDNSAHAAEFTKVGAYHYYAMKEKLFKASEDRYMIGHCNETVIDSHNLKELIVFLTDKHNKIG
jgi:hypothetical protein